MRRQQQSAVPTAAVVFALLLLLRTAAAGSSSSPVLSDDDPEPQPPFVLDARTISAVAAAFLVASLAAAAGVGGGAFFVPLFMLALDFGLKEATVLSQCSIVAVSAASILFNLPKRHPIFKQQTLIAFDMLLALGPALLLGVGVGVILNAALPTWLITTLLVGLLAFMSTRTMQKGLRQWHSETHSAAAAAAAATAAASGGEAAPLLGHSSSSNTAQPDVVVEQHPSAAAAERLPYPWGMVAGVVLVWCGFGALQLLRQSTVKCSAAYWGVTAGQAVFGLGCSAAFAFFCLAKPARDAEGAAGLSAPLLASSSTTTSLTALLTRRQHQQQADLWHMAATVGKVAVAGVVAGVVGVGGGLLMAPMLLDAGIHPQSTSATSNLLVFMSSSSAALAFFLEGRVPQQYAYLFMGVCGAASLLGLSFFARLVKATGRPSIVVLLLACIMGGGGLCSAVFGYLDAWRHGDAGFQGIC